MINMKFSVTIVIRNILVGLAGSYKHVTRVIYESSEKASIVQDFLGNGRVDSLKLVSWLIIVKNSTHTKVCRLQKQK